MSRSFEGFGNRKILSAGFIGRRRGQHWVRQRPRDGARELVLLRARRAGQEHPGPQRVLASLTKDSKNFCTLWCQEVEDAADQTEALVSQLLSYCRGHFGLDWEGVVQQVDRMAGDDPSPRFLCFRQALVHNASGLVLYLDNRESPLVWPKDDSEADFGQRAEPALATIWEDAQQMAQDSKDLYLLASCRHRNEDFGEALRSVGPLPNVALFRLTKWFPALQRLSASSRSPLVARLAGHPPAVEYANDLVEHALARWRDHHGEWSLSEPASTGVLNREWDVLVAPALPRVAERLKDNPL